MAAILYHVSYLLRKEKEMGYYVRTMDNHTEFFMDKKHFDDAYKTMCALNDRDEAKRGGRFGGEGIDSKSPRPAGMDYHPARWFSWLQADYPNHYKTAPELLEGIGFTISYDADGNINGLSYDDKTGQEELFLEAIAPYVREGSRLVWQGEDGAIYAFGFGGNGEMLAQDVSLDYAIRKVLDETMTNEVVKQALEQL
jgi:hypothetical protein